MDLEEVDMLRLHGIIGSSADEETHEKLHHLEHRG